MEGGRHSAHKAQRKKDPHSGSFFLVHTAVHGCVGLFFWSTLQFMAALAGTGLTHLFHPARLDRFTDSKSHAHYKLVIQNPASIQSGVGHREGAKAIQLRGCALYCQLVRLESVELSSWVGKGGLTQLLPKHDHKLGTRKKKPFVWVFFFLWALCALCLRRPPSQLDRPCTPPYVPFTTGSTLRFVSYCQLVMAWMGFGICRSI